MRNHPGKRREGGQGTASIASRFTVARAAGVFDLERCVTSGQLFRWRHRSDNSWLGADGNRWYDVRRARDDEDRRGLGVGTVDCHSPLVTWEVESNAAEADFLRLFRLTSAWDAVAAELIERGPELSLLIDALPGLRLTQPSDPVETLFSFLCSSNNHVPRIKAMVEHLASFGPVLAAFDGQPLHRFPPLEILASVTETDLRARGFGYRAATIPRVAQELLARGGPRYLAGLAAEPVGVARRELLELPGVGPKLADCIALFALHRTESVPIDTHIWQAVTRLYFPEWRDTALTARKYDAAAGFVLNRFGHLAGWAQQYLFYDNLLNWRDRR